MAYSVDLRERVIAYLKEGHTQEETRIIFKVGVSTIKRWLMLLSETGSLENRPLNRLPRKFESEKLNTYIEENPNALLKEIAQHFGGIATGAFHALNREKITLKKTIYYKERDEAERKQFEAELEEISEETDVIYIDESGVQKEMHPTRGRAKQGVRVYQETNGKRTKKDNVIAGYLNGVILALCIYAWSTDADWFCL